MELSAGSSVVILLVHQDRLVIDLLKNELEALRVRVIGAGSVADATRYADAHLPGLMILDMDVEGSTALLTHVRSSDHPCAVVALSGSAEMQRILVSLGVESIVDRDCGLQKLMDAARSYLPESESPTLADSAVPHDIPHVMVVDDEVDFQNLLSSYLVRQGYRVSVARNGKQALELIERGDVPNAMLVDIRMPEMGGLELLSHLKAYRRAPGVLLVTALDDLEIARRAADLGAFDYILKPFDFDRLREALIACLDEVEYARRPWWKRLIT
jgi:two-component system response regulator (stage 0 sporulation protein F)